MNALALNEIKRESNFKRFRNRWKRRGLLEIDETNAKHAFTTYIREGVSKHLISLEEASKQDSEVITESRKNKVTETIIVERQKDKQKYRLKSFASDVFKRIRNQLGLTDESFLSIISDGNLFEFISNSKSGQLFFLTQDKQFIIKTQTKKDKCFFISILQRYVDHLHNFPHSLLVKYLGFFKITIGRNQNVYFSIMQSVLFPDERISERYDLKACEAGRYTPLTDTDDKTLTVLKDINFEGQDINLDGQKDWFMRQLKIDVEFLRTIYVIDYSLLLGVHKLQEDEKYHLDNLAEISIRAHRSTDRDQSVFRHAKAKFMNATTSDQSMDCTNLPGTVASLDPDQFPHVHLSDEESVEQNRRLLPLNRNELHVINGVDHRYYIGIIDFFTTFSTKKKLEGVYKKLYYLSSKKSYSTVHPDIYAARFVGFFSNHTS